MTFWKWTFLKYDKCPNLISSKKCFFAALKNLEEKYQIVCRSENAAENKRSDNILKIVFGIFKTFFGHFYIFGSMARLNNVIEPSQEKSVFSPTSM